MKSKSCQKMNVFRQYSKAVCLKFSIFTLFFKMPRMRPYYYLLVSLSFFTAQVGRAVDCTLCMYPDLMKSKFFIKPY